MPWAAAAAVVGAGVSAYSSKKASKQQARSAREGMEAQERMFERGLEETAPFREAGIAAVGDYQNLLTSGGRAGFLQDYYNSAEYNQMQQQATANALRAKSVGGLRGGSTYAALESIAPQLGQSALSSQIANQLALVNAGQGLAGQASSQANVLGQGLAGGHNQIGAAQAGGTMAQGQAFSNLLGQMAGTFGG